MDQPVQGSFVPRPPAVGAETLMQASRTANPQQSQGPERAMDVAEELQVGPERIQEREMIGGNYVGPPELEDPQGSRTLDTSPEPTFRVFEPIPVGLLGDTIEVRRVRAPHNASMPPELAVDQGLIDIPGAESVSERRRDVRMFETQPQNYYLQGLDPQMDLDSNTLAASGNRWENGGPASAALSDPEGEAAEIQPEPMDLDAEEPSPAKVLAGKRKATEPRKKAEQRLKRRKSKTTSLPLVLKDVALPRPRGVEGRSLRPNPKAKVLQD